MIYFIGIVFLLYFTVMIRVWVDAIKMPFFTSEISPPQTTFSIVVPFRNEAENLPNLLSSLADIDYPNDLFEIILVNDESNDNSLAVIETFLRDRPEDHKSWKVLENHRFSGSPKKDAITLANDRASNDWMVATDADCSVPQDWLTLLNSCIVENKPKMVFGPIIYPESGPLENYFQFLDGLSLQALTLAGFSRRHPLICNGANMAYSRHVFQEVEGYKDNNQLASGDDIFLMEKVRACYPESLYFLKSPDYLVKTQAENSLREIISQRVRWASKTSNQPNMQVKLLGLLVFLTNLAFIFAFIGIRTITQHLWTFVGLILAKFIIDYAVIVSTAGMYRKKLSLMKYLVCALVYPLINTWVVFLSLFGSYSWKGRKFRK